jgi:methanogenic corrinoid protein MtbC1
MGNFQMEAGSAIDEKQNLIAEAVTNKHFEKKPELETRYSAAGRTKCHQDTVYHLSYLSDALRVSEPSLFVDYVVWAKEMLAGRGIPEKDLADNLLILRDSLAEKLPSDYSKIACSYVDEGVEKLNKNQTKTNSFINSDEPFAELANSYLDALLRGRRDIASRLILDQIQWKGAKVKDLYLYVFQKAQHEIGRLWQINQLSVAQEHYCTAATQMIMSQLYPYIFQTEKNGKTLVATCVSGDLHEIGVRMVSDFFEMEGWDTFYLGANVPTSDFLKTLKERNADLALISATMTFHLRHVRELIEKIRADKETQQVKIMVGGYPFNVASNLWREIGADAFASDAQSAVEIGEKLLETINES